HQAALAACFHQHYFDAATQTLAVNAGDKLFAYVYLDPVNLPSELMLHWNDGTWDHRAYWGANLIDYGTAGTTGRYYVGPLPAAGRWVRLELPASAVALEGSTLKGMAFSLYDGRATWDYAGKVTQSSSPSLPAVTLTASDPNAAVSGSPDAVSGNGSDYLEAVGVQSRLDGASLPGVQTASKGGSLPTVIVTASDANAAEASQDPGVFTVTRNKSKNAPLTVTYTLGGSATNGIDYNTLSRSVTIPAGSTTATVTVTPVDDPQAEGSK